MAMRSEEEANRAIELYADTVRRICMIHLKNYSDTEDIFQTVFLKYVLRSAPFESPEHEKAWIIHVTINSCRDLLKSFFHSRTVPLDTAIGKPQDTEYEYPELIEAVLSLPVKYVDINPSLELGINRFDRIVSVEGYNDDGRELAASLNIKYMNYADGVAQILEDQNIEDYLSQDALLSLTVAGENAEQYDEILADMESCASAHANVSCHSGDVEEMHEAHAEGVSLGKYRAFLRLQELDPSVTLDDIRDLTMREIQDLIDEYSAPAEESGSVGTSTGSQYEPESGHHGSDYGNSHENRHNRSRHEHE